MPPPSTVEMSGGRRPDESQPKGNANTASASGDTAAKASREPMQALLNNFRLAGRHIVRDAREMWQEVVPIEMESLKLPVLPKMRSTAA